MAKKYFVETLVNTNGRVTGQAVCEAYRCDDGSYASKRLHTYSVHGRSKAEAATALYLAKLMRDDLNAGIK